MLSPRSTNRRTSTTRSFGGPSSFDIELFGDWKKVENLVNKLETSVAAGAILGRQAAAKKIHNLVKKKIRENGGDTNWPAYSEKYKKYKQTKAASRANSFYRLTNTFYKNITTWNSGLKTFIGIKGNKKAVSLDGKKKNITLHQVAQILEYGSTVRNIRPRPLWGPVFKEFGGNKQVSALIAYHVRTQIRIKTGVTAKVTI